MTHPSSCPSNFSAVHDTCKVQTSTGTIIVGSSSLDSSTCPRDSGLCTVHHLERSVGTGASTSIGLTVPPTNWNCLRATDVACSVATCMGDLFDACLDLEDQHIAEGRSEGVRDGRAAGLAEGRELGQQKGVEIGSEVGFYAGFCQVRAVRVSSDVCECHSSQQHLPCCMSRQGCCGCMQALRQARAEHAEALERVDRQVAAIEDLVSRFPLRDPKVRTTAG